MGCIVKREAWLDVKPRGAARPRFGNGRTYTPAEYRAHLEELRLRIGSAFGGARFNGALRVVVEFYFAPLASWSKREREAMLSSWESVPLAFDGDNLVKAVFDACNALVWVDDKWVKEFAVSKSYSDREGIRLRIEEIHDEDHESGVPDVIEELNLRDRIAILERRLEAAEAALKERAV